ncbi:MAG TPA: hypothetical protein PLB18_07140, partial [Acidobacteriota bacterium]|nr:hypothetical protein [Acidobacteriota bacterium]
HQRSGTKTEADNSGENHRTGLSAPGYGGDSCGVIKLLSFQGTNPSFQRKILTSLVYLKFQRRLIWASIPGKEPPHWKQPADCRVYELGTRCSPVPFTGLSPVHGFK